MWYCPINHSRQSFTHDTQTHRSSTNNSSFLLWWQRTASLSWSFLLCFDSRSNRKKHWKRGPKPIDLVNYEHEFPLFTLFSLSKTISKVHVILRPKRSRTCAPLVSLHSRCVKSNISNLGACRHEESRTQSESGREMTHKQASCESNYVRDVLAYETTTRLQECVWWEIRTDFIGSRQTSWVVESKPNESTTDFGRKRLISLKSLSCNSNFGIVIEVTFKINRHKSIFFIRNFSFEIRLSQSTSIQSINYLQFKLFSFY